VAEPHVEHPVRDPAPDRLARLEYVLAAPDSSHARVLESHEEIREEVLSPHSVRVGEDDDVVAGGPHPEREGVALAGRDSHEDANSRVPRRPVVGELQDQRLCVVDDENDFVRALGEPGSEREA
jgi:hypothetical protein